MKIEILQLNAIWENKASNLDKVTELVRNKMGCQTYILPKLFSTGTLKEDAAASAESIPGNTTNALSVLAKENKVNIITSIIEKTDGKPYDAGILVNAEGKILHKYRAKHLFGPIGEKDHYSEGKDAITAFSLDGVKCGLAICYDIRFPEVFRKLAEDGARVIFVVANWPKPKEDIWKTLLKARAMENQVFIIGANRVGKSPDAEYFGKSLIIDPYGSVIKEGSENEEVMESDIDTSMVEDARKKVFYLKDRRV